MELVDPKPAMRRNGEERMHCVDVAMGRKPADLVITGGDLLCVRSGEILPGWGVATAGRRIAAIGDVSSCIGPDTDVIDARGLLLIPGLCDGHVHIESSFLSPARYAQVVLATGTTSVMEDPHEICNVIGLDGVRYFLEENARLPINIWPQIPSAVPPSDLETSAADIGADEVWEALAWSGVVGLGEVMAIDQVLGNEARLRGMIDAARQRRQSVEGHALRLRGHEAGAYAAAGVASDHEAHPQDFLDKLRRGMAIQIRVGGWWQNSFQEMVAEALKGGLDTHSLMLVSDDRHPCDLQKLGSMDYNVRCAIESGVPAIQAVQMATINVACHFGQTQEFGEIAPGRLADILLISNLHELQVVTTIANGQIVSRNDKKMAGYSDLDIPSYVCDTVRLSHMLTREDFLVRAPSGTTRVEIILPSYSRPTGTVLLPVVNGMIERDHGVDVTKVAVVERHGRVGNIGLGFVRGLGFHRGAFASTVAHDAHNMIVIGGSEAEMAIAANRAAQMGGGIVVVEGEQVLAELSLPVAGLMSPASPEEVIARLQRVDEAIRKLGGADWLGEKPAMTLTFLALTAAFEILVTDLGLVDTRKGRSISLWA